MKYLVLITNSKQSPGMDLSQAFWLAAHDGYVAEAKGLVLAWKDAGDLPPKIRSRHRGGLTRSMASHRTLETSRHHTRTR
ncbi:MAG: hypothetical protein RIT45_3159 [Pseudomonadota bacterium]